MDSSEINLKEMNDRLLSILKCPTCSDYIVPPIAMCSEGHTFCETCSSKLLSCSTCKAQFTGRNYSMEKVAELVMYPCKYASAGCDAKLRLYDKRIHEQDCLLRRLHCLFTDCKVEVSRPDYLHHLKNKHDHRLVVGTNKVVCFSTRNGSESEWVYSAFDHFFLVIHTTEGDKLQWEVIYEGSNDEASKFYFTSTMRNHTSIQYTRLYKPTSPYNTIQYSSTPSSIESRDMGYITYSHSAFIDNFLREYCDRADTMSLPVEIKIHKIP